MMKPASLSLALLLILTAVPAVFGQTKPQDTAVNEAVYRQANVILLRQKLTDARAAQERGALPTAAKMYDEAWALVQKIGSGVDAEREQTAAGLATVRLNLAKAAQHKLRIVEVPITVRYGGVGNPSTKQPVSHGMELVAAAIKLVAEDRPLLMLGIPGMILFLVAVVLGVDLLTTFNETRYFSIPKALFMGFSVTGGFALMISGLLLYAISRIGRKIERKGYE